MVFFHHHRAFRFGLTLVLFTLILNGCIGYRKTLEQVDRLALGGQYMQAVQALDESKLASSSKDRLLYLMERGLLLNLAGEYKESNRTLQAADDLTEELVTRSLSGEALSFVVNDSTVPYRGEDYESAYLNYYKALNFLALGDFEAAAVEARRVDEKLNWYFDLYDGKNSYREDAFLRLLTGLLYEAYGDPGNAQVAYRRSLNAYENQQELYKVATPRLLWKRLLYLSDQLGYRDEHARYLGQAPADLNWQQQQDALLVLLVDRGHIPPKREAALPVPTSRGQWIKVSIPVLDQETKLSHQADVRVNADKIGVVESVGNLDAIARRSLEDKKGRILLKETARAVTKESLARKTEDQYGAAAGIAFRIVSILTANADLRSWRLLPSRIDMVMVPLHAGEHQVEIAVGGKSIKKQVELEKGQVTFLHQRFFY
ncbi:MAG TPA: hypothetical protein VJ974_06850 [Geopsychrobacteraceae bacterium]|nr:hypothetical protein [Geopsychrobacteraceae bacterium]